MDEIYGDNKLLPVTGTGSAKTDCRARGSNSVGTIANEKDYAILDASSGVTEET